jgi:hypothetical protein
MRQQDLGDRVGMSQTRIGELERGDGWSAPLDTWVSIGLALGRPLGVGLSRDIEPEALADAGHLAAQELLLRLARPTARRAAPELPTRPRDPSRSVDVGLIDDPARVLIINEIWNRLDDLGAAYRATSRKTAEAEQLAVLLGGDGPPYRVAVCWLLVDAAANRRLVAAYPELLAARFPGSSARWVGALTAGREPPVEPGLVWIDPRAGRITAWHRRRGANG